MSAPEPSVPVTDTLATMLASRSGLSPVMVGRAAELERLIDLAATAAATGTPGVAWVAGEAGVGKTRLIQELVGRVGTDTVTLVGQAAPLSSGRPFHLLVELVEAHIAGWAEVPDALAPRADALRVLLGTANPALSPCDDRSYSQEELLRAGVDLIRHLVGRGPGLLILEDLHWADADSVTLLSRLALSSDLPAMLVGTYRPEDVHRRLPIAELVADLDRRRSVAHVVLHRLARHEVADLLSAVYHRPVGYRAVEALHARTGGNPLFLEELLLTAGDADPEQLASIPLPWSLAEAVLRHLDGLDPEQRRLVDAASVLGDRISFDVLAAVAGISENVLIDGLRTLVRQGLLVEAEPDVFSFRHALTREAVAGELLGRERRQLHEKALAAMQESGSDDYATLAHHAQGCGRFDEMVAVARQGATSFLRRGSTAEALRLAELGLTEASADVELLSLATRAAWMVGVLDAATEHARRWRQEAARSEDDVEEQRALRLLSRILWEAGDDTGHRAATEEVLALAETGGPSPELAWALALTSESLMLHNRGDEAAIWADRAIALANDLGLRQVRAAALVNKGSAFVEMAGHEAEGVALLEEAIEVATSIGDNYVAHRGMYNLIQSQVSVWPLARTRAAIEQARIMSERAGRSGSDQMRTVLCADVAELEGDLEGALGWLVEGRRDEPFAVSGHERFCYLAMEATFLLDLSHLDEAASIIEEQLPAIITEIDRGGAGARPEETWVPALQAIHAALSEDLPRAKARLADAAALVGGARPDGEALVRAVLVLLRHGLDPATARAALARVDRDAMSVVPDQPVGASSCLSPGMGYGKPLRRLLVDQASAALAEAEGRPEDALTGWLAAGGAAADGRNGEGDADGEGAAAGGAAVPAPAFHVPPQVRANAHEGAARALLAVGRIDEARRHADEAVALLDSWPGWQRQQALILRRRLGGTAVPGRGSGSAPGALTAREKEVAALVSDGLSNSEIARRLYISAKTASVHVSNMLAKLGMSSRTEIAAWWPTSEG